MASIHACFTPFLRYFARHQQNATDAIAAAINTQHIRSTSLIFTLFCKVFLASIRGPQTPTTEDSVRRPSSNAYAVRGTGGKLLRYTLPPVGAHELYHPATHFVKYPHIRVANIQVRF